MKKKKRIQQYEDFLARRKRMLNEISEENLIYEESQTGPQEEATLQEIYLQLDRLQKTKDGQK